jgi:hypothetical protein
VGGDRSSVPCGVPQCENERDRMTEASLERIPLQVAAAQLCLEVS